MKKIIIILLLGLGGFTGFINVSAQTSYRPSAENLKARKWFQDAKMGLFIHWGVYSTLGDGEWVMQNQKIPVNLYEKLPNFFNPIKFNAEAWVAMAKNAGMKYITITTKHHDGFAMYDSKVSDYNIVDASPYGRDIFRQLEQACKKEGIKLFAYYSQLDWHHPDYFPRGWTGRNTQRPESGDWESYLAYQDAQIKELAENYDIAGFWFDGWWDQAPDKEDWKKAVDYRIQGVDWKLAQTYAMIHQVKSALLIGNNHHEAPFAGEDFQMFEKDLPGENTTGFGTAAKDIGQLPLETCETINTSWGFNLQDDKHKSLETLVKYVVNAAGRNANFLLNVGPMPDGSIQTEHINLLKELGNWVEKHGESIYGTRGGRIQKIDKYVSTQKGNVLYLHILDPSLSELTLGDIAKVKKITRLDSEEEVSFKVTKSQVKFSVPRQAGDIVTVLKIQLK